MRDIKINRLWKAYPGVTVFQDFSWSIPAEKCTCLMAPSGKGKTTLLRLLAGLEKPDSGMLEIPADTRIAYVFQEDRLCPWLTVESNIRLVKPALSREEVHCALAAVGLEEAAERRAGELSGGMKRRTALVRALLSDWDLLILDEPFTGLDEAMKGQTAAWAREKINGKTVLLVTHEEEDAAMLGAEIAKDIL